MRFFQIHTKEKKENEKDVDIDFGIHKVYADNEKDAIKYVETEIANNFLSMGLGHGVKIERKSKYSIVHMWDDENIKYRRIVIWAKQVK